MTMVIKKTLGPKTVAAGEFKAKCLALMDEVERTGQPLVITKRGRPVARLVPEIAASQSLFGSMRGSAVILGDIISPLDEPWEALSDEA
ncbi:MAG: type II toxin-antitoxin system Phd/YefM family antitoxin [Alphaproteobacteria bacterium]|nr:type II toxin-antitoxin system Phd/YefM family antitoxin [Alphaproteobacteria bacterium]